MSQAAAALVYSDQEYISVPVSSLVHRKTSLTDLFVRLPTERMVRVAHKGGAIDMDSISRLSDKHVQSLYVHKSEFADVVHDLVKGAQALSSVGKVPQDMKLAKYFSIAESVYVDLLKFPVSNESVGRAVTLSQEISSSMLEKPDFTKLIKTVVGMGEEFAKHSVGSVVMSNLLCTQLEWTSPKLIQPVTMGAFFHDVGLKEIPQELWFKNRAKMNFEENRLWETHPVLGAQILSQFTTVSADVLRIVQEHHELPNGMGFPAKMRFERMFPMAKVVAFGNILAHDIFDGTAPFSLDALAQKIDHAYAPMFGADLARAARRIFKKDDK